jgi:surface protein
MEENFNNLENMELIAEEGDTPREKRRISRLYIIIPLLLIIIIGIIIIIVILLKGNDNNEESKEKCQKGLDDKCATCENDKCGSCNVGYELEDGICKVNFSFKATYETNGEKEEIILLNDIYRENIIEIIIDKINVSSCSKYSFDQSGEHQVYIKMNLENLTSLNLFENATSLTSVYFSKEFDTKNISSLKNLFMECTNLKSVDISNFNFENVEDMSNMFYDCLSLKSINFPNSTTPNLKTMDSMFESCQNLR